MLRLSKKTLAYLIVVIIPFVFLFLPQEWFIPLKTNILQTSSGPLRLILYPFEEIRKILFYHVTYQEYQDFKKQVDPLIHRAWHQEEIYKENLRLRQLLDFKRQASFSLLAAHIVMRDPGNWSATAIVDKGSVHGVRAGMPVVTPSGVVGKIAEVGAHLSKITLLTDPRFSVAAIVQRTRDQGVVSGTLRGSCRMHYLPIIADVKVGDVVVTSQISSFFPEGLLIGRIINIQESPTSPTLDCWIKPAVVFSQLEEVLIVISKEQPSR